jgi:hypothetical protein
VVTRAAALALLASVALAGCSSGGTRDRNQRQTAIYLAVIRATLPPVASSEPLPLVFVSPLAEDRPPALEVQAALIDKLSSEARVKFVDEEREAIDSRRRVRPAGRALPVGGRRRGASPPPAAGRRRVDGGAGRRASQPPGRQEELTVRKR